jgi:hypothetical protein
MSFKGEYKHIKGEVKNIQVQYAQTAPFRTFKIDNQNIQLMTVKPPIINNGDIIRVAGYEEDGILNTMIYKNKTQGTANISEMKKIGLYMLLGIIFLVIGLIVLLGGILSKTVFFIIFGIIFTAVGYNTLQKYFKLQKCIKAIRNNF